MIFSEKCDSFCRKISDYDDATIKYKRYDDDDDDDDDVDGAVSNVITR